MQMVSVWNHPGMYIWYCCTGLSGIPYALVCRSSVYRYSHLFHFVFHPDSYSVSFGNHDNNPQKKTDRPYQCGIACLLLLYCSACMACHVNHLTMLRYGIYKLLPTGKSFIIQIDERIIQNDKRLFLFIHRINHRHAST